MSTETTQAPAPAPSQATSELPGGAAAAPADGGAAPGNEQQPTNQGEAPQNGGEGSRTPEHRTPQYRFSELTRQRNEEREARIRAEARAATLEEVFSRGAMPRQEQAPQPEPAAPKAPDPKDYQLGKFDDQYIEDRAAWIAEERVRAALKEQREAAERSEREAHFEAERQKGVELYRGAMSAADELEATDPRYVGTREFLREVDRSEGFGAPGRIVDLFINAENPAHVAGYFRANPGKFEELRSANPYARGVIVGRIDAQYSAWRRSQSSQRAQPAPAAPSPNPAPSPSPTPTVGNSGGAPIDLSRASFKDFEAHFNQVRARSEAARG